MHLPIRSLTTLFHRPFLFSERISRHLQTLLMRRSVRIWALKSGPDKTPWAKHPILTSRQMTSGAGARAIEDSYGSEAGEYAESCEANPGQYEQSCEADPGQYEQSCEAGAGEYEQ